MNVSILFIELMIIGFQTLIWITLLIFLQVSGSLNALIFKCMGLTSFSLIIIGTCYTLGVFSDRLADLLFAKWNEKLKNIIIQNPSPNIGTMRYLIGKNDSNLNVFLDYTRSRIRICRASAFNIPLIMLSLILYLVIKHKYTITDSMIYTILLLGSGLSFISIYTWKNLTIRHLNLIKTMFKEYKKTSSNASNGH